MRAELQSVQHQQPHLCADARPLPGLIGELQSQGTRRKACHLLPCITHRGSFKAKLSEVAGLRAGLVRCFTSLEPKLRALHPVRGTTGSLSQSNSSSCSRGRARGSCSQEAVLVEEGMGSGAEGGSRLGRASRKSSQQTPVGKFHMVGGGMKENQREFLSLWMRSG